MLYTAPMPLSADPPLPLSFENAVRLRLIVSLYEEHRPELADLVESAELQITDEGLWVRPDAGYAGVSSGWLEPRLLSAALEGGLAITTVQVLA